MQTHTHTHTNTMPTIRLHQFYYVFGILALVFLILVITCAEISILCCYLQLATEDYHWWWPSFWSSGSTALVRCWAQAYESGEDHLGADCTVPFRVSCDPTPYSDFVLRSMCTCTRSNTSQPTWISPNSPPVRVKVHTFSWHFAPAQTNIPCEYGLSSLVSSMHVFLQFCYSLATLFWLVSLCSL